ncbi:MAG: hypothetical protein Q9210_001868 [Variospora velana]
MANAEKDVPSQASRAEAVAEAGMAADDTRPTAVPISAEGGPDHDERSSPSSSTDQVVEAKAGEAVAAQEEEPRMSKGKIALIMLALCIAVFLAALDTTIITTAVPTIASRFNASQADYTWIGSAYLLAAAASTPTWGKFSDIWGRKPILLVANVVFLAGSLIAALSTGIKMLLAGRAIQGIGVPFDGLAFVIILLYLDIETPKTPLLAGLKAIDWLGSLTIVGGTIMFLLGLEYGGVSHPWTSATVICLIVFGLVTIGLFFLNEWKLAVYPVMPLRLFTYRSNIAAFTVCFCHGTVFIAGAYFLPLYFQAVLGASPILSGVYTFPFVLSLSFVSAAVGVIIKKTGQYLPSIWFGMFVMTLGFGLYIDLKDYPSWSRIIIYQIVAGIGVGPNFQSPLIALQTLVKPKDIATATATFGFTRNIATSISVVIGGVIFQNGMSKRRNILAASLPPDIADFLSGGSAGAATDIVKNLPAAQKRVADQVYTDSLRTMWIYYVAIAAVGFGASLLIKKTKLNAMAEDQPSPQSPDENSGGDDEPDSTSEEQKSSGDSDDPVLGNVIVDDVKGSCLDCISSVADKDCGAFGNRLDRASNPGLTLKGRGIVGLPLSAQDAARIRQEASHEGGPNKLAEAGYVLGQQYERRPLAPTQAPVERTITADKKAGVEVIDLESDV